MYDRSVHIIGQSSARYPCKTFANKVAGLQSIGCDFIENNICVSQKYIGITFNSLDDLYCVKD